MLSLYPVFVNSLFSLKHPFSRVKFKLRDLHPAYFLLSLVHVSLPANSLPAIFLFVRNFCFRLISTDLFKLAQVIPHVDQLLTFQIRFHISSLCTFFPFSIQRFPVRIALPLESVLIPCCCLHTNIVPGI